MLVIADQHRPVVVAGIMGGEESGVDAETRDVVLEVAIFRRQSIRATSKRLGLSSDSSYRYERGVDPHGLPEARQRALNLIVELAGGTVCGPSRQVGGDVPWQREVVVSPSWIRERVGFEIPNADMRQSLEALALNVTREMTGSDGAPEWVVRIPSWRDDLDRPIDLVEEVLRLYGTEKIPVANVSAPGLLNEDDPVSEFTRRASTMLVGQCFNECVTYTLRSQAEVRAWSSEDSLSPLALANPFVEDQSHLRPTLMTGLLEVLSLNRARGVEVSRLFETGRIFLPHNGEIQECVAVAFLIAEEDAPPTWLRREPADFYSTKRLVESLAQEAGVDLARQPLLPNDAATDGWQQGHHAHLGGLAHGWSARFGLLDLGLLQSLGVKGRVYGGLFAILPAKLTRPTARPRYQPFSLFPPALRDLAIVVPEDRAAAEVQKAVMKAARAATGQAFSLESARVFDVYRGPGVPAGHKSIAYSLSFRSSERTLTDEEVNSVFTRIQDDLTKAGYSIRR